MHPPLEQSMTLRTSWCPQSPTRNATTKKICSIAAKCDGIKTVQSTPEPSSCTSSSSGCRQRGRGLPGFDPRVWPPARGCGRGGNAHVCRSAADSGCTVRMLKGRRSCDEALMERSCLPSLVTASLICLQDAKIHNMNGKSSSRFVKIYT
jgi:hypothetical protein